MSLRNNFQKKKRSSLALPSTSTVPTAELNSSLPSSTAEAAHDDDVQIMNSLSVTRAAEGQDNEL